MVDAAAAVVAAAAALVVDAAAVMIDYVINLLDVKDEKYFLILFAYLYIIEKRGVLC